MSVKSIHKVFNLPFCQFKSYNILIFFTFCFFFFKLKAALWVELTHENVNSNSTHLAAFLHLKGLPFNKI